MRFFPLLLIISITAFGADSVENSFSNVASILAKHCLDCHAVDDPEGKFIVENHDLIMKGGESGPALIPGKPDESLLVKMVEGKFEKDGKVKFMPPGKREKLSPEEIATIRGWITAGAPAPKETTVVAKEIVVPKIAPKLPPRRAINALAFSEKGNLLALGRYGEVEIHSTESQSLVRTLSGPTGNVNGLAFSSDGKTLYAAGGDVGIAGEIRAWNVTDGSLIRTINGHTDAVYSLALSPDGKILATGSYDQKIKLWSTDTGAELRTLSGHNGCVYGLSFRADGKILASASGDRTIKLWDVATGDRRDTLSQPLKEQYTAQFSPDGALLVAGGVDKRIRVWSISSEATETTNPILESKFGHEGAVLKLAFSADGKSLVSSAEDKTVKLWEVPAFKERRLLATQPDWPSALAFINNDKAIAVGRLDGSLAYYTAESGEPLAPPKPELARLEPRGLQRGVPTKLKLIGKNLQNTTAIKFSNDKLSATISTNPAPNSTELWIEVNSTADLTRAPYELSVVTPTGETARLKLYLDDLSQLIENESPSTQSITSLPVTIWGSHHTSGDVDTFTFTANADDEIIFDASAKSLASKSELVLRLLDSHGKVIASNNNFDSTGDPFIAHRFTASGEYRLQVEELVLGGSPDHFYRIAIGKFPFVTAVYPPVVPRAEEMQIELIGHNLPPEFRTQTINAKEGTALSVKLDPEKLRWRTDFKLKIAATPLALESEPNDYHANATSIQAPGMASGRFTADDKEDWFRFEAKAAQQFIIETSAARLGSPTDTRIEVRDAHGKPVLRTLLQAVRESAVTFRGIDSVNPDCRVENWEEMELTQYLYFGGEVVRLFRAPQGPDSGFLFYTINGKRRNYFDTTASAHADAEPCYIVEPHPPGAKLVPNGLPVFEVFYENDDDADRKLGTDSKINFRAPADGIYFVRVTDPRSFSGDRHLYTLAIREPKPDFNISIDGMNPTVAKGSGQRFAVNADRIDGFEGEIRVEISDLPSGFIASNPIIIQEGHTTAFGTLNATDSATPPPADHRTKIVASAQINGQRVEKTGSTLGKITLADTAPLYVTLETGSVPEITIAPGGIVPAHLKIRRAGHADLVTFQVENLPHGIIVDNIGLNGVLIPKDQNDREIFFRAERWVPDTDRLAYAVANEAGRQTSLPILIKVSRSANQVATSK
ncbi:MAG TPA: c-type cytochrome domain-containing protein [Verrucomicrobiae bacterium]